jgi:hypothetical protein
MRKDGAAIPEDMQAVEDVKEADDQGHMSAASIAKLRLGAGGGVDQSVELWVTSIAVAENGDSGAKISVTIDLGDAGILPGREGQLKIRGGDLIRGAHFRVDGVSGKACHATIDVGQGAAAIVQAHAQGMLVAVFARWPSPAESA